MNFYDKINLLISRKVRKKKINMLVTGGQTAKGLYKYWQKNNYFLNKKSINFFLSDERIVPTNQKYSNYNSLKKNLFFNNGSIKYKFFTFFEDKTKMTKQIKKYEKKLPKHFDIAILSSGNDGHVASIFSNKKNYLNTRKKITFSYSAKKPRKRVTLSLKFIKKTKIIIIMFKGTKRGEIAAETKINPKNRKFVISNFIKNYWIFDKKAHTAYTKKLLNQIKKKLNILVTATPFCEDSKEPIKLLKKHNLNFIFYSKDIKTESKLINLLKDKDIVIAGLENYSEKVLKKSKRLKLISRVGIGLDNIDLNSAKKYNVCVTNTPDGPTAAVVEFTIGLIFSSLRLIHKSYLNILNSIWTRETGFRIEHCIVGIIGVGRTGMGVVNLLNKLGVKKILVNDINYKNIKFKKNIFKATKQKIYKQADIISLHIPHTKKTNKLISYKEFNKFKKNTILINTSRGGIVDEKALYSALKNKKLFSAAMDVFIEEPYKGQLKKLKNCLLTSHMASMSKDCRIKMETEATEEAIRFINNKKLKNLVG